MRPSPQIGREIMTPRYIKITVTKSTLSDGSEVFGVDFDGVVISAVTELDAHHLADEFTEAILRHTNETPRQMAAA